MFDRCTFVASITKMKIKPEDRKLDLESLGWLFQNKFKLRLGACGGWISPGSTRRK
jgi:hypothetical protein